MILAIFLGLLLQGKPKPLIVFERPNIIFVILDDVGDHDINVVDTPTIDSIANAGLNFRRGYSMPVCAATRRTFMFGDYAESAGPICQNNGNALTPEANWISIPSIFEMQKYNTALFGKWHLGTNSFGMPWQMTPRLEPYEFDDTFAVVPGNVSSLCAGFEGDYYSWLSVENDFSFIEDEYQTVVLRDKFIAWWQDTVGPKFAYVSFQAAHAPFNEPPAELLPYLPDPTGKTANRIQFEKLIISIDFVLSQMLSVVDIQNTYIILIGDNGTPPNAIGPGQISTKVKTSPYEGGIRVPFMIAGPGITPGTSDSLVSVVDILPTLGALLNVPEDVVDGVSLLPVLQNSTAVVHDHVFASNDGDRAVIQSRFKLIRLQGVEKFFDLSVDPQENSPVNPSLIDPLIVASLRDAMAGYIQRGL